MVAVAALALPAHIRPPPPHWNVIVDVHLVQLGITPHPPIKGRARSAMPARTLHRLRGRARCSFSDRNQHSTEGCCRIPRLPASSQHACDPISCLSCGHCSLTLATAIDGTTLKASLVHEASSRQGWTPNAKRVLQVNGCNIRDKVHVGTVRQSATLVTM